MGLVLFNTHVTLPGVSHSAGSTLLSVPGLCPTCSSSAVSSQKHAGHWKVSLLSPWNMARQDPDPVGLSLETD